MCVEMYLQLQPDSPQARAHADLLGQLVYEPAFNVLRTQEQLGYSLHTGMRLTHGMTGFCVIVISGRCFDGLHGIRVVLCVYCMVSVYRDGMCTMACISICCCFSCMHKLAHPSHFLSPLTSQLPPPHKPPPPHPHRDPWCCTCGCPH